ncbi:hypothetical protein MPPM_0773 [Methylorubrum populi]|uniref:Uncharacterized protein n=1 Tax=Methylorubrum populi TaxID=223967 RepID=A0A169QPB9_9HYPH|nr:hypothetical protein [Methylorubrum populi]BAU89378.1 hypothetical protein MPPM_0773 [Methylorubrum populi]
MTPKNLTPKMMDRILELCVPKLSEEDLLILEGKLAKMIPAETLAADSALKRRTLLAMDSRKRGTASHRQYAGRALSVTEQKALAKDASPIPAVDVGVLEAMFPNMKRMQ